MSIVVRHETVGSQQRINSFFVSSQAADVERRLLMAEEAALQGDASVDALNRLQAVGERLEAIGATSAAR